MTPVYAIRSARFKAVAFDYLVLFQPDGTSTNLKILPQFVLNGASERTR